MTGWVEIFSFAKIILAKRDSFLAVYIFGRSWWRSFKHREGEGLSLLSSLVVLIDSRPTISVVFMRWKIEF